MQPLVQLLTGLQEPAQGLAVPGASTAPSQERPGPRGSLLAPATFLATQIVQASPEGAGAGIEAGLVSVFLRLLQPEEGAPPIDPASQVFAARALCGLALTDTRVRAMLKEGLRAGGGMYGDPVLAAHTQRLRAILGPA